MTPTGGKLDLWPVAEPLGKLHGSVGSWLLSILLHGIVLGGATMLATMLSFPLTGQEHQLDVALVDGSSMGSDAPTEPAEAARVEPVAPAPVAKPESPRVETPTIVQPAVSPQPRAKMKTPPSQPRPLREAEPVQAAPVQPSSMIVERSAPEVRQDSEPLQTERTESAIGEPPASTHRETYEQVAVLPPSRPEPPVPPTAAPATPSDDPAAVSTPAPSPPSQPAQSAQPSQDTASRATPRADANAPQAGRADYGWLADALWSRMEKMKRYPQQARINHWEGKVILRAVIREDGELLDLDIARSSGHSVLDEEAVASVRQAFPIILPRALGKPQVALQIPISYQLDR